MRYFSRNRRLPDSITIRTAWSRYVRRAVGAALPLLVVVCTRSAGTAPASGDRARYHDKVFRVVRVVDGDTIDIDAPDNGKMVTRIRLWGVDTPEVGHASTNAMYFGADAARFAERTLAGKSVYVVLSPRRTRGKYGRLLAYVFLERGGRMFNEMLLEEGYAYADLRFRHHYFDQFKALEERARRARAGLWAEVTPDRMPSWKQRFERSGSGGGD